jgi:hypothetical protein
MMKLVKLKHNAQISRRSKIQKLSILPATSIGLIIPGVYFYLNNHSRIVCGTPKKIKVKK